MVSPPGLDDDESDCVLGTGVDVRSGCKTGFNGDIEKQGSRMPGKKDGVPLSIKGDPCVFRGRRCCEVSGQTAKGGKTMAMNREYVQGLRIEGCGGLRDSGACVCVWCVYICGSRWQVSHEG